MTRLICKKTTGLPMMLLISTVFVNDDHLYDVIAVMLPLCLCDYMLLLVYEVQSNLC